jgi:hypothetical protein
MATKVSMLVRTLGQAQTDVWPVTAWDRFEQLIADVGPARAGESAEGSAAPSPASGRTVSAHDIALPLGDGAAIAEILTLDPTYEEFEIALPGPRERATSWSFLSGAVKKKLGLTVERIAEDGRTVYRVLSVPGRLIALAGSGPLRYGVAALSFLIEVARVARRAVGAEDQIGPVRPALADLHATRYRHRRPSSGPTSPADTGRNTPLAVCWGTRARTRALPPSGVV